MVAIRGRKLSFFDPSAMEPKEIAVKRFPSAAAFVNELVQASEIAK
jgi:hypothetical protein